MWIFCITVMLEQAVRSSSIAIKSLYCPPLSSIKSVCGTYLFSFTVLDVLFPLYILVGIGSNILTLPSLCFIPLYWLHWME